MAKPAIEPPKVHTINRLYWQKFPYCVELDFAARLSAKNPNSWYNSKWSDGFTASRGKPGTKAKALIPTDKKIAKVVRAYYQWKVYFVNESDFDAFLVDMQTLEKEVAVTGVWKPESTEHLELLKQDHKLVTRDSLFYDKYTWKITFKPGYQLESKDELVEWINEIYKTDDVVESGKYGKTWASPRYRFCESNHIPILYLSDEDDVVMAKLIYTSSIKKIEKAVILADQNNNNKGNADEPGTVSQTG
jgi:hypothetical protein